MSDKKHLLPKLDTSQFTMLPLSRVELNEGQLPGLPPNPRGITKDKFQKLKNNIEAYPEMLAWRSLLVYPLDNGKYIIIGGNMRYRAMIDLKHAHAPVYIIPADTPVDRLRAYTILDNGDFGEWDWDMLANEWPEDDLNDWGVDIPLDWTVDPEKCSDEFSLPDGDKGNTRQVRFVLSAQQAEIIKQMVDCVKSDAPESVAENDGNSNKNGNALFIIVKQWAEQKKLL